MSDTLWRLAAVPLLIAVNAFFVVAEYALVAVRSGQVEALRPRFPIAAAAISKLKSRMASAIGTIQICITMTNLLLGWVGEPAMTRIILACFPASWTQRPGLAAISTGVSFVVVTLLTVVLGELVPKAVTLQHTARLAMLTAAPILHLRTVLAPLVWVMDKLANLTTLTLGLGPVHIGEAAASAEEISHIATEAAESGNLTPRERSLILNSLTLGKRRADEVMVPRNRVSYLDLAQTMTQNKRAIGEYLHSRFPVCDGGLDKVVGIVYTKEFLVAQEEMAGEQDSSVLQLIMRPPVFVPETAALDRLLQTFAERKTHMVFLVNEHGAVRGIVTLTDVVDEVLGKMSEEDEVEDTDVLEDAGTYLIVRGQMPITQLARQLGRPDWTPEDDVRSVGGLLTARLGRLPQVGEGGAIDGVVLSCHARSDRAVEQVKVIVSSQ